MNKAKSFEIPKTLVWNAWLAVKANGGSAGIDGVTIEQFETDLKRNLYKLWNRLSSGSYMPTAVKRVEIPKSDGSARPLGIPTISDRIAQTVVKLVLEKPLETLFHPSSFGYRPGKSAHEAVAQAKANCWKYKWVIDIDIRGFFDNMNHELMLKAVNHVTENTWIKLYIQRWLKAEITLSDGQRQKPTQGTPQGGVISPLLANLFLHYALDKWLQEKFPSLLFERYADDIVCHCRTKFQAEFILKAIKSRLQACKLELHPQKTKVVCCLTKSKRNRVDNCQFNFLGFTFQRRVARMKEGERFTGFLPAISKEAKKAIVRKIGSWKLHRWTGATVEEIAKKINPHVQGWLNYYGKFYKSKMQFLWDALEFRLMKWFRSQYKQYKGRKMKSSKALALIRAKQPTLFAHWRYALVRKD